MKIIHTGDWHIGKIVNEFSMIEDQEFILEQLIKTIEDERPDALIIAGDIYDRSIPPVEAVELLDRVFTNILVDLKTPILAIAGNHDSAERLSFGSNLLTKNGLHIAGVFNKNITKVTLKDEYGNVNFYLIPYIDPRELKIFLQDDSISNHDDAMKKIVDMIKVDLNENEKNIMVTHGYVSYIKEENNEETEEYIRAGLEISDSERPLSIGGTDIINAECFSCFNYTALGHLHRPQKVKDDRIRYSGALLKYSLSEVEHKKSLTIINLDKDGQVSVELKELIPKRDMRVIKGPLEELINPEIYKGTNVEDYIFAILTDEGELIDPISKLRAVYPNIMGLNRETLSNKDESRTSATLGYKSKSKLELFKEFYGSIAGKELNEEKLNIIKEIIGTVDKKEGIK
ncbi:exonuclease SbcCD subunit D [uncultured Clostridium sp.]|uniref:exonuclease SbcCD subunit D n=1 Tax=uncultured Clostridium sp. TaxID=59620 RepID=UPI0028F0EFFF|nr:exonuclease SbcCD subunit D [uncultured Clostridium sp.]